MRAVVALALGKIGRRQGRYDVDISVGLIQFEQVDGVIQFAFRKLLGSVVPLWTHNVGPGWMAILAPSVVLGDLLHVPRVYWSSA